MENLAISERRNVSINDLVFGKNVIVLAKETISTNDKTGEVTNKIRYIEVCPVENTEPLTVVRNLLKYIAAEYYVRRDIEKDFKSTNVKQKSIFTQFLSNNRVIFRTNSEGKISQAFVSQIPLNQTAFNIKEYHTIANCKKENFKAAVFQHSKVILIQCTIFDLIGKKVKSLENLIAEVDKTETKVTTKKTTTRKKTVKTVIAPAPQAVA